MMIRRTHTISCFTATLLSLVACGSPEGVDETGYLRAPEIDSTSLDELGNSLRPVLIVGTMGAVEVSGGQLSALSSSGGTAAISVDDPLGSFVLEVDAKAGDSVSLVYELAGEDSLVLQLPTKVPAAPICSACVDGLFTIIAGLAKTDLSLIDNVEPPFTFFNTTTGVAVDAPVIDFTGVSAVTGDTVCLSGTINGVQGLASCEVVME